jgi:hypothetical protein
MGSSNPKEIYYSLRPIFLFANIDVSRHILVVDTSVLAKSNMGRREYYFLIEAIAWFQKQSSKRSFFQ